MFDWWLDTDDEGNDEGWGNPPDADYPYDPSDDDDPEDSPRTLQSGREFLPFDPYSIIGSDDDIWAYVITSNEAAWEHVRGQVFADAGDALAYLLEAGIIAFSRVVELLNDDGTYEYLVEIDDDTDKQRRAARARARRKAKAGKSA